MARTTYLICKSIVVVAGVVFLLGCGRAHEKQNAWIDSELIRLEQLPLPQNVAQESWDAKKLQLRGVIVKRNISSPPTSLGASPVLSYDGAQDELHWGHYFPGDYDQNGVVSVSDLTPLAVHLNQSAGNPDTIAGVCDGDGNGLVTLADLTPIGANLGLSIQGYRVYRSENQNDFPPSPSAANGPGAELAASFLLSEAIGEKTAQRLAFTHSVTPSSVDTYYWVRSFDGAEEGAASNLILIQPDAPPLNQAPQADLQASPNGGATPLQVQLDASGSIDDKAIVRYEWDLDDDGVFEQDGGTEPATTAWFYVPGDYSLAVRVSDAEGLTSVQSVVVTASFGASWHKQVIDTVNSSGTDLACDLIGPDKPGLFYVGEPVLEPTLVFRKAADTLATGWNDVVELVVNPPQGFAPGVVGGKPALIHNSTGPSQLLFRLAEDSEGATWQSAQTAAAQQSEPQGMNLIEVNLRPAITSITFQGFFNFIASLNSTGTGWAAPQELGVKTEAADLATLDGLPAVAFRNTYGNLLFASALNPQGDLWSLPSVVEAVSITGQTPRLLDLQGMPAIVYADLTFEQIRFVRAQGSSGVDWQQPVVLDVKAAGQVVVDQMPDGRIAVAYATRSDAELRVRISNDPLGVGWSAPQVVETDDLDTQELAANKSIDLEIVAGVPTVAYYQKGLTPAALRNLSFGNYY